MTGVTAGIIQEGINYAVGKREAPCIGWDTVIVRNKVLDAVEQLASPGTQTR